MGLIRANLVSIGLCTMLALTGSARADVLMIGRFSAGDLSGWQTKSFKGETQYRLVRADGVPVVSNGADGQRVLRAESRGTASGLFKRLHVDLTRTPILHWRWRVDNILTGIDERTKQGDDYPARIYVVISGGVWFWRTQALNYVWSSYQPQGASWPNAFTSHAVMLAVESGSAKLGRWVDFRRDVRQDLRRYLGMEARSIDAVAIMTDTDNSGQHAVAYYGDIYFSSE